MSSGNRKGQWGHSGSCIATVRFFSSILYLRGWSIYEDTILNSEHVYSGKIRDYLALKSLKSTWFAYIKYGISKSILASLISFEVKCLISFLTIYNFKNEDSLQKVFFLNTPPPLLSLVRQTHSPTPISHPCWVCCYVRLIRILKQTKQCSWQSCQKTVYEKSSTSKFSEFTK